MSAGAFLFGKLPAHGDFVARGLSAEARDALDQWLSLSLAEAEARLGAGFADAYGAAPPWRFAWADGVAGAMAPSIDSVGRHFPLIVGQRGLDGAGIAAVEARLYDALSERWDADRLHAAASAVASGHAGAGPEGWWTVDTDGREAMRVAGRHPAGLVTTMLTQEEGAWPAA